MTTEIDTIYKTRRDAVARLFSYGAVLAVGLVLGAIMTPQDKAKPEPPPTVNWIGKFCAGDGNGRVFTANNLEVGIATDGTLRVREVAVPIKLTSGTNTP